MSRAGRLRRLWRAAVPIVLASCAPKPAESPAGRALTAPKVAPGDLDAAVLLGDVPQRAQKLGAGPMSLVANAEASPGERVGAFVDVPADVCLLGYARASSSIEDVDIAMFDEEGSPLVLDEGPDPKPTVLLCPPHPARVYVAAHVADGEGLVGVAVQMVARDRANEVARALSAHGTALGGPRPADGWPGLDDHVRAHRETMGDGWEETRRVAVTLDARVSTAVGFPLEANQCVDVVIVPDEEVALLEVEALDEAGRVLARAHDGGSDRALTVCSSITINGSLAIRPHVGRGLAALVFARARGAAARGVAAHPDVAWAAPTVPLDAAVHARNAALARAAYGPSMSTAGGTLAIGRRATTRVDLAQPPGACARVDVVAGAPLALVDAKVWDEKGALLAEGDGVASATLFACARGKARLDLDAIGRPGPFSALLRPERWVSPVFAAHPLAAGRMLAEAATGPEMLFEGTATAARAATLEASRIVSWDEPLNAGQCVRVAVGAEGEGTGLELRIFDAQANLEVDRAHGEHGVTARACAPANAPRALRVELRTTSGRADAVVGVRTL